MSVGLHLWRLPAMIAGTVAATGALTVGAMQIVPSSNHSSSAIASAEVVSGAGLGVMDCPGGTQFTKLPPGVMVHWLGNESGPSPAPAGWALVDYNPAGTPALSAPPTIVPFDAFHGHVTGWVQATGLRLALISGKVIDDSMVPKALAKCADGSGRAVSPSTAPNSLSPAVVGNFLSPSTTSAGGSAANNTSSGVDQSLPSAQSSTNAAESSATTSNGTTTTDTGAPLLPTLPGTTNPATPGSNGTPSDSTSPTAPGVSGPAPSGSPQTAKGTSPPSSRKPVVSVPPTSGTPTTATSTTDPVVPTDPAPTTDPPTSTATSAAPPTSATAPPTATKLHADPAVIATRAACGKLKTSTRVTVNVSRGVAPYHVVLTYSVGIAIRQVDMSGPGGGGAGTWQATVSSGDFGILAGLGLNTPIVLRVDVTDAAGHSAQLIAANLLTLRTC